MFFVAGLLGMLGMVASVRSPPPSNEALAAFYAPIVYQATGFHPKADAITRVDFDGNLDASDNWESLDDSPTPAHVYSSVIETETHYFLAYGLFHPRDYARVCLPLICHENDFEGALFTVRKGDAAHPFGTLMLVETIAHISVESDWNPTLVPDPVDGHPRVALFVEAEGHAVRTRPGRNVEPAHTLLYRPATVADTPGLDGEFPRGGTFGYTLLSIETELWARRTSVGRHALFTGTATLRGERFQIDDVPLEFNGDNFLGVSKPQAPWGWRGGSGLKLGEIFVDPARATARHDFDQSAFSLDYVRNPFLGIDRREEGIEAGSGVANPSQLH